MVLLVLPLLHAQDEKTELSQAIRLLIDGHDRRSDAVLRPILLRHRRAFIERFEAEHAGAKSIENISVEFLVWFTHGCWA